MTDEADEAPRDTHLPSPMEAKEFPGQVRSLRLFNVTLNQEKLDYRSTQIFKRNSFRSEVYHAPILNA